MLHATVDDVSYSLENIKFNFFFSKFDKKYFEVV